MKRTALVVVLLLAISMAGSAHAQEPTPTPNPTQLISTARAVIATPDFTSAIRYGDLGDLAVLMGLVLLAVLMFLLWIVHEFLMPPRGGG